MPCSALGPGTKSRSGEPGAGSQSRRVGDRRVRLAGSRRAQRKALALLEYQPCVNSAGVRCVPSRARARPSRRASRVAKKPGRASVAWQLAAKATSARKAGSASAAAALLRIPLRATTSRLIARDPALGSRLVGAKAAAPPALKPETAELHRRYQLAGSALHWLGR